MANPCLQQDVFLYTKISCLPAGRGFGSELVKPEMNKMSIAEWEGKSKEPGRAFDAPAKGEGK